MLLPLNCPVVTKIAELLLFFFKHDALSPLIPINQPDVMARRGVLICFKNAGQRQVLLPLKCPHFYKIQIESPGQNAAQSHLNLSFTKK